MLICLDAGHYLGTPGKRCLKTIDPGETREWTLNARIADRVQAILSSYQCATMRVDDVTGKCEVALQARTAKANRAKADVYVSIHHNAGVGGGSGGGISVFVSPRASGQSRRLQQAVYGHTVAATGLKGNRANPMPEKNLYVLTHTQMPAVLGEFGFMDSAADTPVILTETFAQQAAQGIAAALVEVYGLKEVESMSYEQWQEYMERYRRELAQRPATMPELLTNAKALGLTDATRPGDFVTREECAIMARAAARK